MNLRKIILTLMIIVINIQQKIQSTLIPKVMM